MLRLDQKLLNIEIGSPFVKMLAYCWGDGMWKTFIYPSATRSRTKWMSISTCLVLNRIWREIHNADIIAKYDGSFLKRRTHLKKEIAKTSELYNRISNTSIFSLNAWSWNRVLSIWKPGDQIITEENAKTVYFLLILRFSHASCDHSSSDPCSF